MRDESCWQLPTSEQAAFDRISINVLGYEEPASPRPRAEPGPSSRSKGSFAYSGSSVYIKKRKLMIISKSPDIAAAAIARDSFLVCPTLTKENEKQLTLEAMIIGARMHYACAGAVAKRRLRDYSSLAASTSTSAATCDASSPNCS